MSQSQPKFGYQMSQFSMQTMQKNKQYIKYRQLVLCRYFVQMPYGPFLQKNIKCSSLGRWYAPTCVTVGVTARDHSISISSIRISILKSINIISLSISSISYQLSSVISYHRSSVISYQLVMVTSHQSSLSVISQQ